MKLRNGFVSNSSSSSFVVAADDPTKVQITIDLTKYASSWGKFKGIIRSHEDLVEYISDGLWIEDKETFEEALAHERNNDLALEYDAIAQALAAGKTVICGYASYNESDDGIELMLGNACREQLKSMGLDVISAEW